FLWKTTKIGARVIITHDEPAAVEISNAKLLAPTPRPQQSARALIAADGKGMIAAAKAVARSEDQPELSVASNEGPANGVAAAPFTQPKFDPYRNGPVSVFVSRKTSKLYVRYDYEPLFEMPVTISDPARPLGTHVFTAVGSNDEGLRWTAISVPTPAKGESETVRSKRSERITAAISESDVGDLRAAQTPAAA